MTSDTSSAKMLQSTLGNNKKVHFNRKYLAESEVKKAKRFKKSMHIACGGLLVSS
jgi:hypothetical protein